MTAAANHIKKAKLILEISFKTTLIEIVPTIKAVKQETNIGAEKLRFSVVKMAYNAAAKLAGMLIKKLIITALF